MKLGLIIIVAFLSFGVFAQNQSVDILTSAQCKMCKSRIEKELIYTKGVLNANLNMETKIVTIEYKESKTNIDNLRITITNIGYDADSIPANKKLYEKLPACCQKPE